MAQSVFDSPALPLLLELEDAALQAGVELSVSITATGRLHVAPKSLLTPERTERIRACRDALRLLMQIASPDVQARTAAFREQLQAYRGPSVHPALRFRARALSPSSGCVSCGEPTDAPTWCARCQTAARLARDGDIPADWVPAGPAIRRTAA